jgi:hypothetical protein
MLSFVLVRITLVVLARQAQPQAVIEGRRDLGRIPISQPATGRFVLSNGGGAELLVVDTKANCECVLPRLANRVAPPGGWVPFDVTFTPKKPGRRQQNILIETNDPVHPVTVLTITADVYDPATRPTTMASPRDGGMTP